MKRARLRIRQMLGARTVVAPAPFGHLDDAAIDKLAEHLARYVGAKDEAQKADAHGS